jgi:uncharacterized protein YggU (UPF0235/DUF167 family)
MRVLVRVRPRSARTGVGGRHHDGGLVVSVREPAVDGRATLAVIKALAASFDVPPSRVVLRSGATSRSKLFEIEGDDTALMRRLQDLLDA